MTVRADRDGRSRPARARHRSDLGDLGGTGAPCASPTRSARSRASGSSTSWQARRPPSTGPAPARSTPSPTSGRWPRWSAVVGHDRHVVRTRASTPVGDDWRFRVYFRGPGSTLAELVPILGQLGLQAVEEHPGHVRHRRRPGVALRDRGARRGGRDRRRLAADGAAAGVRRPRARARSSRDGLNRLVLDGGLDIRQIACPPALPPVPPPGRVPVQRAVRRAARSCDRRRSRARSSNCSTPDSTRPRGSIRWSEQPRRIDIRPSSSTSLDCGAVARRRSDLPGVPHPDRRHRPDQRVPSGQPRRDRGEAATRATSRSSPNRARSSRSSCARRSVEGVHLRGGPIARGGLRWSDRPRTSAPRCSG